MRLENFTKTQIRISVSGLRKNLVPDFWTADGERELSDLDSCPLDNSCCVRAAKNGADGVQIIRC